jgi:glycerol-3-phosphate dehydrogenase
MTARYAALPPALVIALVKRHGTRTPAILGDAKVKADLGREFAENLTEREVAYLVREEWARSADDILWRRTKCGLDASAVARETLAAHVGA